MYGERFDIPDPDELLMIGWFPGGEVFRSLCTWTRGLGASSTSSRATRRTRPTTTRTSLRIIANACHWAAPAHRPRHDPALQSPALEPRPGA